MTQKNDSSKKTQEPRNDKSHIVKDTATATAQIVKASTILTDEKGDLKIGTFCSFVIVALAFGFYLAILLNPNIGNNLVDSSRSKADATKANEAAIIAKKSEDSFKREAQNLNSQLSDANAKVNELKAQTTNLEKKLVTAATDLESAEKNVSHFTEATASTFTLRNGKRATVTTNLSGKEQSEVTIKLLDTSHSQLKDWNNIHSDWLTAFEIPAGAGQKLILEGAIKIDRNNEKRSFIYPGISLMEVHPPAKLVYVRNGSTTTITIEAK